MLIIGHRCSVRQSQPAASQSVDMHSVSLELLFWKLIAAEIRRQGERTRNDRTPDRPVVVVAIKSIPPSSS